MAISLILKGLLSFQDTVLNSDGVVYIEAARMIAEGSFSQSLLLYPMPAYPLLIAAVHCIVPNWIIAAKLITVIAAALVTIPIYFLTACLFDRRAAFYAALATALLPSLNDIAPDAIRDPIFLLLGCGSVYWMIKACVAERIRSVLMAFILAGAALLFRIEALSLFLSYLVYLVGLWVFVQDQRRFAGKTLLLLTVPVLIGMVGLVGIGATSGGIDRIDQLRAFGRHVLSGRFFERYQDIYAHLKTSEQLSPMPSGELYKLARHYMPFLYVIGILEAFFKSLFWPYAVPLYAACRRFAAQGMALLILTVILHSLLVLIYLLHIDYLSSRYLLFCALLALPLVGQGVTLLDDLCRPRPWRNMCLAALGLVFLVLPLYRSVEQGLGEDKTIAMAGKWLAGQAELQKAAWAVDDLRYYVHADRPFDYLKEKKETIAIGRRYLEKDYGALEQTALEAGKEVLILKRSRKEAAGGVDFKVFRTIKQIEGPRSIVTIYADTRVLKKDFDDSGGASN